MQRMLHCSPKNTSEVKTVEVAAKIPPVFSLLHNSASLTAAVALYACRLTLRLMRSGFFFQHCNVGILSEEEYKQIITTAAKA